MMVEQKGSDRNKEGFPFIISLSLSLKLYDLNKDIWIYLNQVCKMTQTRWGNRKLIGGSWITLNTYLRVLIFEGILLFMLICKCIVFGFICFNVLCYWETWWRPIPLEPTQYRIFLENGMIHFHKMKPISSYLL